MPKVSEAHFMKKRKEILAAAEAVFSRKGFEPATMQDVVDESGMSRGGVYQYFSSTEEMMRALLDENSQIFGEHIQDLIDRQGTMWEAIEEYLKSVADDINDPISMAIYEYFVSGWRIEERRAYLYQRYDRWKSFMITIFHEGVRRGEFHPIQPIETITQFFMNVTDGLALEAKLINDRTVGVRGQIDALKLYLSAALGIKDSLH